MTTTSYRRSEFPSEEAVPGIWWTPHPEADLLRAAFPPSSWDMRALRHIEEHLANGGAVSDAYAALFSQGDPAIRYLASLIADEERRHHQILQHLAGVLREKLAGERHEPDETELEVLSAERRAALLEETKRLLDIERSDASALKELQADLRPARNETLWPLLAEMMEADSDKHVRVLRAIERRLRHH